jgi:hypothetical protein
MNHLGRLTAGRSSSWPSTELHSSMHVVRGQLNLLFKSQGAYERVASMYVRIIILAAFAQSGKSGAEWDLKLTYSALRVDML